MKNTTIARKLSDETKKFLQFNWNIRLKLRTEGLKLWAEANKLRTEANKLYAEANKLRAEGDKLRAEGVKVWAEGDKLWVEANKLWVETILEFCGNITLKWEWRNEKNANACILGTGDVFEP